MTDSGPFDVLGFIGGGRRFEDKRRLGRPKDLAVLNLLEAVLLKQCGG